MRINAYVLAADPAWIEESVASYYPLVDRIVVSYDVASTSWAGTPLDVDEALRRLKGVDPEGKAELVPGTYWRPDHDPLANDTHQRRQALASAGEGADWVVQLDTDEVVRDLDVLRDCLEEADRRGFAGLEYPARNLYQYVGGARYLERSRRLGRVAGHYPGPVVVRPGVDLRVARQSTAHLFRVDLAAHNTDPSHPRTAPVHRVVDPAAAIRHFSWVRSVDQMRDKTQAWGHAHDVDWRPRLQAWEASRHHPRAAVLRAERGARQDAGHSLRLTTLADAPDAEALRRNGIEP